MVNFQGDSKAIFKVFIGAIIAVTFMIVIGDAIFPQTNIATQGNTTVTAPAINATTDLTGRTLVSSINVLNATSNVTITSGVLLQTGIGTNGLNSVQITVNDTATAFAGESIRIAYTYQPDGYLDNSGARAIALLVLIFGSLSIMVFVVVMFIKEGSLGKLMGRS